MAKKSITRKSNKYVFTLKNVDTEQVDKKFGIVFVSNILEEDDIVPQNTTKLSELIIKSTPEIISFLDESKYMRKCNVSMIDFNSKEEISPFGYHCFWCRHPFETRTIGCPIRYVSKTATKTYYSEISKDTYTIKENVPNTKTVISDKVTISKTPYYETDGIFCSFDCTAAFILDNKHNKIYNHSISLLMKMYNDMMGTSTEIINPAPHWRLLQEYGGYMNITEFRNSFNKADYDYHGTVKNFPEFRSMGLLFEERLRF